MKKVWLVVLPLLLCMGLWGCGKQETAAEESAIVPTQSQSFTENAEIVEPVENEDENTVEISYDEKGKMVQSYYDEDGNMVQTYYDEEGNTIVVCIEPDGSRTETRNNIDGSLVSIYENPATGEYIETEFSKDFVRIREKGYIPSRDKHVETEYYENGNLKWSHVQEPSSGVTSEQEYYENGNKKWMKTSHPQEEREAKYNEEGYCTYYHSTSRLKNGDPYEIECIGDEAGKLIRIIENGEETDDEKLFDLCIGSYNFR